MNGKDARKECQVMSKTSDILPPLIEVGTCYISLNSDNSERYYGLSTAWAAFYNKRQES